MTTRQKVITLKEFKGLNLKGDPAELDFGELVKANNIDITDKKKVRLRKGQTRIDETGTRKLWADGKGRMLLAVQGADLVYYDVNLSTSTVRSGINLNQIPDFELVGTDAYYTDGINTGRVLKDGTDADWKVEEPGGTPALSSAGGSLYAGTYHVAVTYVHADGRESGTGESAQVTVNSGIALSNIPVPVSANIATKRIYATEANGLQLRFVAEVSAATTSYTITSRRMGDTLDKQFLCPPPAGTQVAFTRSRLFVAQGPYVFASIPYSYHLFDVRYEYFAFSEDVELMARTETGLYISADQLYFIDLTGEDASPRVISTSKAIPGTKTYIPSEDIGEGEPGEMLPCFAMENGIMLGSNDGSLTNTTESTLELGKIASGASMYRKEGGITQIVTTLRGVGTERGANLYEDPTTIGTIKQGVSLESFNLIDHEGKPVIDHETKPVVYQE